MIPGSNKDHPSFLKSFSYAMEGFVTAVKTERNIKVMLVAGVCTVIAGCIVGLDIAEWATIIICCGLVIHGELCNTAMEAIVSFIDKSDRKSTRLNSSHSSVSRMPSSA